MNAYGDLLAELVKPYPEEDFSWMVDLVPRGEDESEEQPERERERMIELIMYLKSRLGETLPPNDLYIFILK